MATAMIRALRAKFPYAQIDMVVRGDFLDLVKDNPHLDRVIGLPRRSGWTGLYRLLGDLNRERYDLVYDAHRSLRTRVLMPFLKAPHKAYYRKHYTKRALGLTFKIKSLLDRTRMLERYIEPLAPWGVRYDGLGPEMFVPTKPALVEERVVGLVPSAQWPGKRWAPERFREMLKILLAETNYRFVVFGGKDDTFCDEIARGFDESRVLNTQGKLTLAESCAALKNCDFVIANDTGLMHVADALDKPSVLFLGPTSEEMGCLPFHPKSIVLEHRLWCRPCSKNGQAPCIRKERYCLTLTSPRDAAEAAKRLAGELGA